MRRLPQLLRLCLSPERVSVSGMRFLTLTIEDGSATFLDAAEPFEGVAGRPVSLTLIMDEDEVATLIEKLAVGAAELWRSTPPALPQPVHLDAPPTGYSLKVVL